MFGDSHGDRPTNQDHYASPPPGIEERYSSAVNASDLTVHEEKRGPAHLLVASGLAAKSDQDAQTNKPRAFDKPSIAMGGALARLQSEWHSVEKPVRQLPKTVRQWVDDLPKVQTGVRMVKGKQVPIMAFDRDGAKSKHQEQRAQLDALYEQELKFLAQKLPSRFWIRGRLFLIAVYWKLPDPEALVAEVLAYWLDDTCRACHGTGEIIAGAVTEKGEILAGEKVLTCPTCEGRKKAQVPHERNGQRLFDYMEESKHAWAQTVAATSRRIHNAR